VFDPSQALKLLKPPVLEQSRVISTPFHGESTTEVSIDRVYDGNQCSR
jgi:hypothetical protein